jgi:response regulator RpfG family c-di-GMP phosphodiesterase
MNGVKDSFSSVEIKQYRSMNGMLIITVLLGIFASSSQIIEYYIYNLGYSQLVMFLVFNLLLNTAIIIDFYIVSKSHLKIAMIILVLLLTAMISFYSFMLGNTEMHDFYILFIVGSIGLIDNSRWKVINTVYCALIFIVTEIILIYYVPFINVSDQIIHLYIVRNKIMLGVGLIFLVFHVNSENSNYYHFLETQKAEAEEEASKLSILFDQNKHKLSMFRDVIFETMGILAQYRDEETGGHIIRTQKYIELLANELKKDDRYSYFFTDENIELLIKSAPLHDLGKIAISDDILLKPSDLTVEEFSKMKQHTHFGKDIIQSVANRLGEDNFLSIALDLAYTHHERWDGSGYPNNISGIDIPIVGRLMAITDVYDALRSKRVYKNPLTHRQSMDIIISSKGTQFDPVIVDIFASLETKIELIHEIYKDHKYTT